MHTIDHLIETRGKKNPESIAFYKHTASGDVPVSAKNFCIQKRALACGLEHLGLKRGEVVGILSSVRYEWELAEKAVLSLGAATFGIDVRHTTEEIGKEIETGSITMLIVENETLLQNVPSTFIGNIVLIDNGVEISRSTYSMETLMQDNEGNVPQQKAAPDDFAIIISTSGTTGAPKLIRYRNRHMVAACLSIIETLEFHTEKGDKTALCWLPLVYMTSKIMNLVDYVVDGSVYFLGNPREISNALQTISPSHFVAVPIFYERLYKGLLDELHKLPFLKRIAIFTILATRKNLHLRIGTSVVRMIRHRLLGKHMRYAISGSAPLSRDIIAFFKALDIDILEAYALSENAIPVAMNTPKRHRIGSVGQPLTRNKIRLTDDGEILVKGDGVFEGYIGLESENSTLFTQDGYLRTGDIGRIDDDGYLFITGRKKNLIKTANGYRISPIEVEAVYETILYIKQIMVVGDRQKFLGALIVLDMPHVEAYLASQGIKKTGKSALKHEATKKLITDELKKHDQSLAIYKRVACFTLLSEPFSVERGELTPNFKMRRDTIMKHYRSEIEDMFTNVDPV